ncbi:MAG TPA: phosphoribosylglycinamide formyltransferase [Acidimicrobiales bacterium]
MRIGVLASGSGTILEAMLERALPVIVVVVDRPCGAVEVAERADVDARVVEREDFGPDFDRVAYSKQIVDVLHEAEVDLVAMAGFGTILDEPVFDAFRGRILNTHPALLPSFPGWHGVADALAYGVKVTGCTVHVATLEVDAGPIVAQEPVTVLADDTVDTLHERIKAVERRLYPDTLAAVVAGELALPPIPEP